MPPIDMDSDKTSVAYDKVDLGLDTSHRPCVINRRTQAMLDTARAQIGFELGIIQGSFMAGIAADQSEHTHDKGGVIDLRTRDIPQDIGTDRAVRALRAVGFAAFHRTDPPFDEDHIHAVAIGDVTLHPDAAAQVDQYRNGGDGLGGTDTGPRLDPIPIFDYDTQAVDMQLTDKIPGTHDKTVGDALKAALTAERAIEALNKREAARAERHAEHDKRLTEQMAAVTQAVDTLPEGVTKQEVRTLLKDIDATVKLVVTDPADGADNI
jgi:hypothetical protein